MTRKGNTKFFYNLDNRQEKELLSKAGWTVQ